MLKKYLKIKAMKKKFFLIIFFISFIINVKSQVNIQDSLALVDFYNSTDGDHWTNNTNWLTEPVSSWFGITVENNYVVGIKFYFANNLCGEVPESIGNLINLRHLWLYFNPLSKPLPDTLENLINLDTLVIRDNMISWEFPQNIGDLISLKVLDLSFSNLTGTIPESIGNLINLRGLYLTGNDFSGYNLCGEIPASLGNLVNLRTLCLSNDNLCGEVPDSLGNLINLRYLILSNNKFSKPLPLTLENLINLDTLYISNNETNWEIPQNIGDLVSLKLLNCGGSNLTGSIPESIGNLINLEHLSLDGNNLTGSIPESIGNLINLEQLSLGGNNLTGNIPQSIGNLINVKRIYLFHNQLTSEIPSSIGNLINLQDLSLNNNQLTGEIPESIGNLINLKSLGLSYNQLIKIPESFCNLTNLAYVDISYNNLEENIPNCNEFNNLYEIHLEDNQLTGAVPLFSTSNIFQEEIHIQNNRLIDLPNFDSIVNNIYCLIVYNNKFTFEDIEPNINLPCIFNYVPQDSVLNSIDTTIALGDTLILSGLIGGTANQYQWFKDTTEILGATDDALIIPNISYSDSGIYYCSITNTIVTDLTLWRRLIKVNVDTATGIKKEKEKKQVKLYPNPATKRITIEFNSPIKKNTFFELYDVLGNKVMSRQLPGNNNKVNVSTKSFNKGVYSYRITVNDKVISTDKLIIIKK